ncbi:hypothetical protein RR48_04898 [Papilio machaon]|uniref:Uncharacterized protein n=1 Tax=Papilio machaon TaxID=76193 RepID=A0A0N1IQ84_PAPMA|nr:hypothetical protein RR48_04898 [Papilio machaon]
MARSIQRAACVLQRAECMQHAAAAARGGLLGGGEGLQDVRHHDSSYDMGTAAAHFANELRRVSVILGGGV